MICNKRRHWVAATLVLVAITASVPLRVEAIAVYMATPEFRRGETRPKSIALLPASGPARYTKWANYYLAKLVREKGYTTKALNVERINADPQLQELAQQAIYSFNVQLTVYRDTSVFERKLKITKRQLHLGAPADLLASKLEVDGLAFPQVTFFRGSSTILEVFVVSSKTGDLEALYASQVMGWDSPSDAMGQAAQALSGRFPTPTQIIKAKGSTLEGGLRDSPALWPRMVNSLHDGATWGDLDDLKQLIATGADVNASNADGNTPLILAASSGHKDVADLLIAKGAEVNVKNEKSDTPLHGAAAAGHRAVAELLIAKGAEVNAKNTQGNTPLALAAFTGYRDVAELLIAQGAEVNAKNAEGSTPLIVASFYGHADVAELLITKGAEVKASNNKGNTPLAAAASMGNRDVAELLITKGADINAKNQDGNTPLHWAATTGHWAVTDLLIAKGADVNAKNNGGETPRGVATVKGHENVAKLLKQNGGKKK